VKGRGPFEELKNCGLRGVKLVVSDEHQGDKVSGGEFSIKP